MSRRRASHTAAAAAAAANASPSPAAKAGRKRAAPQHDDDHDDDDHHHAQQAHSSCASAKGAVRPGQDADRIQELMVQTITAHLGFATFYDVQKNSDGQPAVLGRGEHSVVFGVVRKSDGVPLALKVELWGPRATHMRLLKHEAHIIDQMSNERKKAVAIAKQKEEGNSGSSSSSAAAAASAVTAGHDSFTRVVNWCQFFPALHHQNEADFVIDALVLPRYTVSLSEWLSDLQQSGLLSVRPSAFATPTPAMIANFPPSALLVRVAREMLLACRDLHAAGVVHRDMQPRNFMFFPQRGDSQSNGNGAAAAAASAAPVPDHRTAPIMTMLDDSQLVLLDYGCGDFFAQVSDAASREPSKKKRKSVEGSSASGSGYTAGLLNGTADYASLRGHEGATQSYRDDIEGIGYLLWHLHMGSLPWLSDADEASVHERKRTSEQQGVMPSFLVHFMLQARALAFDEKPNYDRFVQLVQNACNEQVPAATAHGHALLHVPEDLTTQLSPSQAFQAQKLPPPATPLQPGAIPGIDGPSVGALTGAGISSIGKLLSRYYLVERSREQFYQWLCSVGVAQSAADLCAYAVDLKLKHA